MVEGNCLPGILKYFLINVFVEKCLSPSFVLAKWNFTAVAPHTKSTFLLVSCWLNEILPLLLLTPHAGKTHHRPLLEKIFRRPWLSPCNTVFYILSVSHASELFIFMHTSDHVDLLHNNRHHNQFLPTANCWTGGRPRLSSQRGNVELDPHVVFDDQHVCLPHHFERCAW